MLKELGKTFIMRLKIILQYKYFWFIVLSIIIIISFFRINLKNNSKYSKEEKEFKLVVEEKHKKNDQYIITFKAKERIIYYTKDFPYNVGDIVIVKGDLEKIKKTTIPNTFNYQKYLQSRGINWQLNIKEINLLKENSSLWNNIKSKIILRIEKYQHKEYLYAFILGDTSYFSDDIKDKYQIMGLSYILAIGSLQVMTLIKVLEKIENKMKIRKRNKLIVNTLIIILYIMFTNKIIGVLRSGLCYILKSILDYKKIKVRGYNIILIIGIFLLIINPNYLNNIGFVYSFSISLSISLLKKRIKGTYYKRLLIVSLIAFIVSIPITIYSNYEINFLAIVFSFLLIPVFNFVIFPLCIIVLIFPFLSFILTIVISILEYIINLLSKINFLTFVFKKPSMILVLLYFIIIFLSFYQKKYSIFFLIILFIHHNINLIIKEDLITFLDVNEGDSIVVKSNNSLILIDTGGSNNYEYSDSITKYIKSLGIGKINKLFLTHGDMDHLGSSYNLIEKIKVDNVYFNNNAYNDNEKRLINLLINKKIPYQKISNYIYQMNDYLIKVKSYNLNLENDSSMIMDIENKNYKMLLTADATINTEKVLMNDVNLSKYNLLKIGHHGSKTSTSDIFYNAVNPDISVISVGNRNIYHLPNYEIMNRIRDSKVYLTSTSGSITLFFKDKVILKTCPP